MDEWIEPLSEADLEELKMAVDAGRPFLESHVERWRAELTTGRGFQVIRGIPVEQWGEARCEKFFWALGEQLGIAGAQNPEGDLLGHVRDQGVADDRQSRAYKTRQDIQFHCDAADIVGLLCMVPAKEGGISRICSSVSVHDAVWERRPDLAPRLYEPFVLDTKAEGGLRFFPIEPCRYDGTSVRTFYHSDYFRECERWPDAPRLDERGLELLDLYDSIAAELQLTMWLEPGDIQLLNNHTNVHGRGAFTDAPDRPRHLLRLWVSLHGQGASTYPAWMRLVARLGYQRLRQALAG